MTKINNYLLITSKSPYCSFETQHDIEMLLSFISLDKNINILFTNDSVFSLLANQKNTDQINRKNFNKMLSALPEFGITEIFVCEKSLKQRNLDISNLTNKINIKIIKNINHLISKHRKILT